MIALVTGGASSGKSAVAERLALSLPGPHAYAATMRHGDAETARRIARHQRERAGCGFMTVELAEAAPEDWNLASFGTVLLEDAGNLLANGLDDRIKEVLACENVVVVGNEVGCDGMRYDAFTQAYLNRLGALTCHIAARADMVVEVVAGIPHVVKQPASGEEIVL